MTLLPAAHHRSPRWLLVALAVALPGCLPDNNHLDASSLASADGRAGQAGAVSGYSGQGGSLAGATGGQGSAGSGGPGLAGAGAGAAGGQATMPIGGSSGAGPGPGGSGAVAGSGQGTAGGGPGNGQAGGGQEPPDVAGACPVGPYAGDMSLPEVPSCSCVHHTYQSDETILTFDGAPVVARFLPSGVMYAWHTTEGGVGAPKPGNWLSNAGFPARCARRFASSPGDGQPLDTWAPPAPPGAPTHCYSSGDIVCVSEQQGTIYVKQTAWGQRYLCRSYPGQSFDECQFVPSTWASGAVCNETLANAQQFLDEGEDPAKTRPCGT